MLPLNVIHSLIVISTTHVCEETGLSQEAESHVVHVSQGWKSKILYDDLYDLHSAVKPGRNKENKEADIFFSPASAQGGG